MLGNYRVAAQVVASRVVLSSTVSYIATWLCTTFITLSDRQFSLYKESILEIMAQRSTSEDLQIVGCVNAS
jgi:hypothetical protein